MRNDEDKLIDNVEKQLMVEEPFLEISYFLSRFFLIALSNIILIIFISYLR